MINRSDLLTKNEAAEIVGLSIRSVERAIVTGELDAIRRTNFVRIRRRDFEDWVNRGCPTNRHLKS